MNYDQLFQDITEKVIAGLEGAEKFSKPWSTQDLEPAHNGVTGRPYSGINWLVLSMAAEGYSTSAFLTRNQAIELGGHPQKGEKHTKVFFFKSADNSSEKANGRPTFRYYKVWNADQCGLPEGALTGYNGPTLPGGAASDLAKINNVDLRVGGKEAYFSPASDYVRIPQRAMFISSDHHDAVLLHELTHWTGGTSRLNRTLSSKKVDYAFEELVAELGSAMLGATLGLPYEGLQHSEYVASWLTHLNNDPSYIRKAAIHAGKAVNFLISNIKE
jgi:antirestriction protein ArdC